MIDIIFTRKNSSITSDDRDSRGGTIELEVFNQTLVEKLITLSKAMENNLMLHEPIKKNSMLIELKQANVFMELEGAWVQSLQFNILSSEMAYTTVSIVCDQCIPANNEKVRQYMIRQKLEKL